MKSAINLYVFLFLTFLNFDSNLYCHGFGQGTYIRIYDQQIEAYRSIEQIYEYKIDNLQVKSYSPDSLKRSYQKIKVAGKSKANCFIRISFNTNSCKNFIECSPVQEFFVIESQRWTPAYLLSKNDTLFAENGSGKTITNLEFIRSPSQVYTLEINNTHTFCVGNDAILTHNIPLPIGALFTISVSFGEGAAVGASAGTFFGPVTVGAGIVVGGIIGIAAACLTRDKTKAEYRFEFNADKIEAHFRNSSSKISSGNYNQSSQGSNNINPEDPDDENEGDFKKINWTNHGFKHSPQKNLSWQEVVEYTKEGKAKYKHGIDIEKLERIAWENGTPTTNGKTWKVMEFDFIVGAKNGVETRYIRIETSANTIHGHPITTTEYKALIK